ncbi:MAG: protein-L-isoaspartate(D-aspartate) O-methyltransferase [Acidobacteriaceae bacterium]
MQQLSDPDRYVSQRLAMVEDQLRRRGIHDQRVLRAMEEVPRHEFIPELERHWAYRDQPVPIGEDQTISQPYIVAVMTQFLSVEPENRVLEVGTGTGYQAAVLSRLAGQIYTIERHATLAERAEEIFRHIGYQNIHVVVGDGTRGLPDHAPYDRILVAAAAPSVPPPLLEQLNEGGRMIIPVGTSNTQILQLLRKSHGEIFTSNLEGCRFVPLIGEGGFPPRNS